jgi:hypothetical protein
MKIFEKRNLVVESEVEDGKLLFHFIIETPLNQDEEVETLTAPEVVQLIAKLEGRL